MGMKLAESSDRKTLAECFSAQPRADGDEAFGHCIALFQAETVSVLNREPMGMKRSVTGVGVRWHGCFSAQPRADGDEAWSLSLSAFSAF